MSALVNNLAKFLWFMVSLNFREITLSIILVYKIDLVDGQSTRVDIIQIDTIYQ
ncbi:Serpentine type 7TM GPCR chemoreceptor Srb [Moritella viscosa]|nr:Serpentine type 7TM GPCR chemoreceptor Srb [Moritella viscosa]